MKTATSLRWGRGVMAAGCALLAGLARAEIPRALAAAVQELRAQRSYSWEVINADPGPVAESIETRRGRVTTVRQSIAPHVKGSLTNDGDILLKRDWPDGMQLDALITADGQIVTRTPEGWLSSQEVLTAMADERNTSPADSPRYQWLRRADRPEVLRPDEELVAAIKAVPEFEVTGDTYVGHIQFAENALERNGLSALDVTLTINLRGGVVRDYQVTVQGSRNLARAGVRLPLSDDHFVIITYLPVRKLDVPEEAWAKVRAPKSR